jgi:LAO/AO transport system kinase
VIVINKSDHPLTDTMVREIRGVLSLANLDRTPDEVKGSWRVPIVRTEASRGEGVDELVQRLGEHREHILQAGQLDERRARNLRSEVLAIATARLRRRLEEDLHEDPGFQELLDEVVGRRLDPASAATTLLERAAMFERAVE